MSALPDCVGLLSEFNASRDRLMGRPVQKMEGVRWKPWEPSPGPEQAAFSSLVRIWSENIVPDLRRDFSAFLSPERLVCSFRHGRQHIDRLFSVSSEAGQPVPVRLCVLLYEDISGGDVLRLVYALPAPLWSACGRDALRETGKSAERDVLAIERCYQEMDGDYDEVRKRLSNAALVEKFMVRFLSDRSFETLCNEMEAGNRASAFRAAHTLKGVCANLSFSRLFQSVDRLTEALRRESEEIPESARILLEDVREDYRITVAAIRKFTEQG